MNIFLSNSGVGFLEYSVLALILSILYGFSFVEIMVLQLQDPDGDFTELRKAANWAMIGIFFTLAAGVIAEFNFIIPYVETTFLITPFFFMGRWAIWYIKYSKITNDLIVLKKELDVFLLNGIYESILKESEENQMLNREQLLGKYQDYINVPKAVSAIPSLINYIPMLIPFRDRFSLLHIDSYRLERILTELKSDGKIEISEYGFISPSNRGLKIPNSQFFAKKKRDFLGILKGGRLNSADLLHKKLTIKSLRKVKDYVYQIGSY